MACCLSCACRTCTNRSFRSIRRSTRTSSELRIRCARARVSMTPAPLCPPARGWRPETSRYALVSPVCNRLATPAAQDRPPRSWFDGGSPRGTQMQVEKQLAVATRQCGGLSPDTGRRGEPRPVESGPRGRRSRPSEARPAASAERPVDRLPPGPDPSHQPTKGTNGQPQTPDPPWAAHQGERHG